jgi:glycosyltransferase involved in cell wall biosynthesis
MGEAGTKLIKERYNWNTVADEVLKVYKGVRM